MDQLVFIQNNNVFTDSLMVADVFDKRHDIVLRDIEVQIQKLHEADEQEFSSHNFVESNYTNERGRQYRKINLTEDAFAIVAMSYTTPEAMKMKIKFLSEFKFMKEKLQSKVHVLDERTALIKSLQLTAETAERQDQMEQTLNQTTQKLLEVEAKVDEQITLNSGEQRGFQKAVSRRVYEFTSDKEEASKLFRELYREIKDRFGVPSYKDLRRNELQVALRYIASWIPKRVA